MGALEEASADEGSVVVWEVDLVVGWEADSEGAVAVEAGRVT